MSDDDRLFFLGVLCDVKTKTGANILAYCPMGNHYHFLIEVGEVPISSIMRRLLTRYSKHFNICVFRTISTSISEHSDQRLGPFRPPSRSIPTSVSDHSDHRLRA